MQKKGGAGGAMPQTHYLSKPGGRGGLRGVASKDRARLPPRDGGKRGEMGVVWDDTGESGGKWGNNGGLLEDRLLLQWEAADGVV